MKLPEIDYLKSLLDYDPETGHFTWKVKRGRATVGERAGYQVKNKYRYISIDKVKYLEHRLAYFYMTECDLSGLMVDHINGVKHDNRFDNLRALSPSDNSAHQLRSSNCYQIASGRWASRIHLHGKRIHLGMFDTPEEATAHAHEQRVIMRPALQ